MLALPLALALAAYPALAQESSPIPPAESEEPSFQQHEPRLDLALWGAQLWLQGSGARAGGYGAEATWRFDALDLGAFGGAYGLQRVAADGTLRTYVAPVYLARLGQRFETRSGLTANFTFGLGAARAPQWRSWFQVALGARVALGPAFVAGELAFESDDVLKLALGLGVSLF